MNRSKQVIAIAIPIIFCLLFFYRDNLFQFSQTVFGKLLFVCIILFYAEMNITYGFLALVFVVFYYKIFLSDNTEIILGEPSSVLISQRTVEIDEPTVVPLVIYQTWGTKTLPPKMKECVEKLKKDNPQFEHHLYDDAACREFIKANFKQDVLDTFDQLVPGAYKADLWRYCILYKLGGIYLDIKFQCAPGFSLLEMTNDMDTLVLDRANASTPTLPLKQELELYNSPDLYRALQPITDNTWENRQIGLYNAVMATAPKNPVLYECIQQIVLNVKKRYYGRNPLYPTGPGLLGQLYFKNEYPKKLQTIRFFNTFNGTYIVSKNRVALTQYPEYRTEQKMGKTAPKPYYHDLWVNKNIYMITNPISEKTSVEK